MQGHVGHLQFPEHDGQLLARAAGAREDDFAGLGLERLNQVDKIAVPRLNRVKKRESRKQTV